MQSKQIYWNDIPIDTQKLIDEVILCIIGSYSISMELIQFCLDSLLEKEEYETANYLKKVYEEMHGVNTFKKFKI